MIRYTIIPQFKKVVFLVEGETFNLCEKKIGDKVQAPVVQRVDSAIHWINLYPVDNPIGFPNTYPLHSDLSSE